jgi:hypothetical protein
MFYNIDTRKELKVWRGEKVLAELKELVSKESDRGLLPIALKNSRPVP